MAVEKNNILTDDVIAKKALVLLKNNMVAARLVYRDYEKTFGKVGDTIRLKLPFRTKSASGRTLVKQPLVDQQSRLKLTVKNMLALHIRLKIKLLILNSSLNVT